MSIIYNFKYQHFKLNLLKQILDKSSNARNWIVSNKLNKTTSNDGSFLVFCSLLESCLAV